MDEDQARLLHQYGGLLLDEAEEEGLEPEGNSEPLPEDAGGGAMCLFLVMLGGR